MFNRLRYRKVENIKDVFHVKQYKPMCSRERTELIHKSLAKIMNQLPISFCSSEEFTNFMAVIEPV